ncbi:MAG TPA: glycosyl hydrolase, partial [Acidimicrobiia bacterium]|nr:glycosyl hydrolase [Acidimicrobiia bacterium]
MRTSPHGFRSNASRRAGPAGFARPWRVLLLALVGVAAMVPAVGTPPAAAAGRPAGPLVPASGFYVGAYTKNADGYGQDREQQAITDLESRLGRRLHIDHHYYSWNDVFPSWREQWDIDNDRIPMISWNGENADAIGRGDWDGLISARAQAVAMLNTPVFIRWFWEMDGNKKAAFVSSPASYQKAWRHIHDIFVAAGATNAVWVWCPNASAFDDGDAMPYYPGGAYVDWVCADGYNFAPNRPGDKWESFGDIFSGFYAAATRLGKPLMVGEFGVLERNAGEKAAWFHQAHDWIAAHPAIAAVVYFNADSTNNGISYNWRVDTAPQSFEGFRYLFSGPAPVPPTDPVPSAAPDPAAPEPLPATTTDVAAAPAVPKTGRPRGAAPTTDGALSEVTGDGAPATTGALATGRAP